MKHAVSLDNITAGYGRVRILNGLSFDVSEGEVFGVIGPNGCGKTTMLNVLSGFVTPTSGRLTIFDTDASRLTPHERCSLGVGRTWQIPRPFDKMTVADNVKTGAVHGAKIPIDKAQGAAEEALGIAGLMSKKDCLAGELTLLDRKKLELARALATKARLLLLDEVAAGLTEAEAGEVMDLVKALKERKYTIIWIEHNIEVMLGAADRLMCMSEGRNVILDTPEKVMNSKIVEELYLGSEA